MFNKGADIVFIWCFCAHKHGKIYWILTFIITKTGKRSY